MWRLDGKLQKNGNREKNTKWAEKDKCLTIRTGRQKHEQIEEEVKEVKTDEVASYI